VLSYLDADEDASVVESHNDEHFASEYEISDHFYRIGRITWNNLRHVQRPIVKTASLCLFTLLESKRPEDLRYPYRGSALAAIRGADKHRNRFNRINTDDEDDDDDDDDDGDNDDIKSKRVPEIIAPKDVILSDNADAKINASPDKKLEASDKHEPAHTYEDLHANTCENLQSVASSPSVGQNLKLLKSKRETEQKAERKAEIKAKREAAKKAKETIIDVCTSGEPFIGLPQIIRQWCDLKAPRVVDLARLLGKERTTKILSQILDGTFAGPYKLAEALEAEYAPKAQIEFRFMRVEETTCLAGGGVLRMALMTPAEWYGKYLA
jgi:hypothetical protein